jgi:hypothetical protein
LEKLNKNINNQNEIDSIYDAYSEWISDVRTTINKSSSNDKKIIGNIIKKYEGFKKKYPINSELLQPINFNSISTNNNSELQTPANSNIQTSNTKAAANAISSVKKLPKKSVEYISQVIRELLKKNYGDYIIDDYESIILYKTKNKNSNEKNKLLSYNYKINKFILITQNLHFTFQDFINNSVNKRSEKYIIFKVNNNYLIIDDKNIYLLFNQKHFVLLIDKDDRIKFNEITAYNTISTINRLVSSNSNISEKDFFNFIEKLEHENLHKNKINEYLKELYEKYDELSENNKKKYKHILIQKSQKLLSNSATNFGSNALIQHSVYNKKIKNLLNNRLVSTNSENPQGRVKKFFSNIGSRIKNSFSRKNQEPLIQNFN